MRFPVLYRIDKKGGGCDGPMPMWQILAIQGPEKVLQGIDHVGYLVPWLPNEFQPVGARWVYPIEGDPRSDWTSIALFDKYPVVKRRGHVLYIKGTLVQALFWRVE